MAFAVYAATYNIRSIDNEFKDEYNLLKDIKYFPVAKSTDKNMSYVYYANSWGDKRTYGGERVHEGIDIMAEENVRGKYPVVSMTDGKIENIGWLELGGYRIGIRSKHNGYFYYAHLFSYAEGMEEGKEVKAGQLIGYMGDSGYGKEEGTVGMFAVHLHLGIYINDKAGNEKSINPYYYLRAAEKSVIKYKY
ncbi:MAG: M23 family metallopeptidase [Lachnospiraceae bacterium]|nr:M23 family metallopeptidase [Lachnospiraceae bacterium]